MFYKKKNFSSQKANENTECYKCGNKGHFTRDCFSKTSNPSYQSPVNNSSSVSKGFQPNFTPKLIQSSPNSNSQTNPKFQKDYKVEYKKIKAKLTLLEASPLSPQNPKTFQPKKKGLVAKIFDWDEEEVYDDEEVTQVKVLMALADDELTVGKSHARNGEWVDITIRKVNTLLSMDEDADWQNYLKYTSIDLKKLPNFNTRRILVPKSQAINESLETFDTPESSKDSEAEFLTPLPPLKNLQGASPSSERHIREPIWYLDSGCSRSMTDVKSYLRKYVKQPGHKVVFGDNSFCITEGYGSINYGGIVFTKVAFVNGLKYNLISISQLYDAKKKSQAPKMVISFIRMVENQNDVKVKQIRTDNKTEFRNHELESFCDEKGISQNFSSPYTPEQNGVAKRKNKTLIEEARMMLNGSDHLGKFDAKANDGYFLGYFSVSKDFRLYNTKRQQIEETYHATFDESMEAIRFTNTLVDEIRIDDSFIYPPNEFLHDDGPSRQYQVDSDISYYDIEDPPYLINTEGTHEQNVQDDQMITQPTDVPLGNNTEVSRPITEPLVPDFTQSHIPNQAFTSSHPAPQDRWSRDQHIELVNIIGNPGEGMLTRSMVAKLTAASASECLFADFISKIEPKKVSKALKHPGWIDAMQEELNQFYRNKIWTFVPLPYGKIAIRSKWVFGKKKDEHVERMEAIRIFLAFATYMNFKVYQKDVKSAFLNGKLKEEVYVKQPHGFESSEFLDYVDKLDKALYGLKQAPKACSSVKTPMVPPNNLGPDLAGKPVNESSYMGMIGSLMYLTATRLGFDLKGYSDLDYAGCNMDKKITSCACQILGGKLVCWSAKKQQSVAMSLAEAEYVAAAWCCASIIWMKSQLSEEFWSIVVDLDPFPSTDEPEKYPLKEFLIKFLILTRQRPLTLDFNTFYSSTGLDCNNGKDVDHPTPEVVKKELGKISINPSYLYKTPVLKNSFPMAWRILFTFLIQDKKIRFLPPTLSNCNFTKDPSKVTKIILTAHMIDMNNRKDSVSPASLVAKPKKRKSQTVTSTLPKDITFMTPDEGTAKTTPRPDGSHGDKNSGGNKPPTNIEPQNLTDVDLSGTGAKYQEDQTQSSKLRYQSLTRIEVEPSYEGDLDTQPMILSYVDVQAILLSEDEAQESEEDILGDSEEMDGNPYSTINDLYKGLEFITWLLKEIINSVKDDPATNKKIKEASETLAKISTQTTEILSLVRSFDFSALQSTVKNIQDHTFKQEEALVVWMKSSTNKAWNIGSRILGLERVQAYIKSSMTLQEDTISIKSMMSEMYNAFRGQSSSTPSSNVTLTFSLTDTLANVERKNVTHTTTKEPPSHTERETDANIQDKHEKPKQSTDANISLAHPLTYLQSLKHNPS
nr:hypothetical protein [Tanacetum cinerariifolium]